MRKLFDRLPVALRTDLLEPNLTDETVAHKRKLLEVVDRDLRTGACPGCEFSGWMQPDTILSPDELARLKRTAERLRSETDVLLVIGIGGSYLGARAVIEALADDPDRVVYAGQNISADYIARLREKLERRTNKRGVAINVISKKGDTTETMIAFRLLRDMVGGDARNRIIVTTDPEGGVLRRMVDGGLYEMAFEVPQTIGGRYSVLSAVGLLPIAYAGVDIDDLIEGAADCAALCKNVDPLKNPALFYAVARNILYHQGFAVELLASFEPRLHYFAEWWKQLFGESHGKEHMGLFPASVDYTTDLHSLGQYVQQGRRILFETFVVIDKGERPLKIERGAGNLDGLNYLAGKEVSYVNRMAYEATAQAHREGGVPNMTILLERLDAYSLGALIYFFELACATSGLMLGVDPFDQPGVEAYKTRMFELLGKPGHGKPHSEPPSPQYVVF